MEKGSWNRLMGQDILVIGFTVKSKVSGNKSIMKEMFILGSGKKINIMEKEPISHRKEESSMGNSEMGWSTGKFCGTRKPLVAISLRANTCMMRKMDMESTFGKMGKPTKESLTLDLKFSLHKKTIWVIKEKFLKPWPMKNPN